MSFLPKLRNTSAPSKVEEVRFYGLDRTESAGGGYFSDTKNVMSEDFPFMTSRKERMLYKLPDGMKCLGTYSGKELCFVLGDGIKSYFYYGGELKGEWEDSIQREKVLCEAQGCIYILPDNKFYRMKNEQSIEDYKATHPKVGLSGSGYMQINFDVTPRPLNRKTFDAYNFEHEFDEGDAVTFWAYEKNTGNRVRLYNLPEGVVMSGKESFKDEYLYYNNIHAHNFYETYSSSSSSSSLNKYIRVEYEFTYPEEYNEGFFDFAKDIKTGEVHKDKDGYLYLVIKKDLTSGEPVSANLMQEFINYTFKDGLTAYFTFDAQDLGDVFPEKAIIESCGIDVFWNVNNYTACPYLKFAPNTFTIKDSKWNDSGGGASEEYVILYDSSDEKAYVNASVKYPELTGATVINNRLWGYKGNVIYASSLGKPYIMGDYSGISTDSWALETGIRRNFTSVIEYGSVPHFFTEDKIIKVYGDQPSSFRTAETVCAGVKEGSGNGICLCQGVLYYLDKDGFIDAYTGSYPTVISRKLGEEFESGILVSDERFIYCVLSGKSSNKTIYVYDTLNGIWVIEGEKEITAAAYHDGSVCFFKDGFIESTEKLQNLNFEKYTEAGFESLLEFPVIDEGVFNQKKLKKIFLKVNADVGTSLSVEVRETESPEYARVFERVIKEGDGVLTIPVDCTRTLGYSIRIKGKGRWRLEGILRRVSVGSYKSS